MDLEVKEMDLEVKEVDLEVQTGAPPALNKAQDWQTGHAVHDTSWEPGPFPL